MYRTDNGNSKQHTRSIKKILTAAGKVLVPAFILASWPLIIQHEEYHVRKNPLRRELQSIPAVCYQNMIVNHDFEANGGSTLAWQSASKWNTLETVENGSGNALMVYNRYRINEGARQNLLTRKDCLLGSDFYFRIQAKIRFYDLETGLGVPGCVDDRLISGGTIAKYNCPIVSVSTREAGSSTNDVYEIHVVHLDWDKDDWNDFDIIYKVPPQSTGASIERFLILFWGGPVTVAYLLDDVIMTRLEEPDLPIGHPIYDPKPPPCDINMFQNGDGYYKTPWAWDAYGHWFSEMKIDAVPSETDPNNYILVADERDIPTYQGLGQFITGPECLAGHDYYIRVNARVALVNQPSNTPVTTCSRTRPYDCPFLKIDLRRYGEGTGFSSFYDFTLMDNWNPDGWNPFDVVISLSPDPTAPQIQFIRVTFVGGPVNSLLKLDDAALRRIQYSQIPPGQPIYNYNGVPSGPPRRECATYGDPHIETFGGNSYDHHATGWIPLYIKGGLTVESRQTEWYGTGATFNDAIRVTYMGTVYEFSGGALPDKDNPYFNTNDGKLYFYSPVVHVYIARFKVQNNWVYGAWLSSTDLEGASGLCVDEDFAQAAAANPTPITFDPNAPTQEEAEVICAQLQGTSKYDSCIFDVRAVNDPDMAAAFVQGTLQADQISRTLQTQSAKSVQLIHAGPVYAAAVSGDPIIVGLKNQVLKFDGRSNAWYANLATDTFQWNMKFHQFSNCEKEEGMYITGMSFLVFDESQFPEIGSMETRTPQHSVTIMIQDESAYFPGCSQDGPTHCLGYGSLKIVLDNEVIIMPGKYETPDNEVKVVTYNTFGACSRRCFDCPIKDENNKSDLSHKNHGRSGLRSKRPIDYLLESGSDKVDFATCSQWMEKRVQNDDLLLQAGGWSTIHIETKYISLHVEYRQNQGLDGNCPSHSLDAWITDVSKELHNQLWQGVLGETRFTKLDSAGGQIVSDRSRLLAGKKDSDYEVSGAYGSDFKIRRFRRRAGLSTVGKEAMRRFLSFADSFEGPR